MSEVAYALRVYFLPVLVIGGSVLNMLSFAVMRRIRSSITSNYMATLGLVDSGVLIIGGVSLWMHTVDSSFSFPLLSTITCKLVPFALYTLADLSVFIIVIMTAERFYAVWRPLQASKRGKKRDFKMAMIASIVICAAINSHFVFTHSTRRAKVVEIVDDTTTSLPTSPSPSSSPSAMFFSSFSSSSTSFSPSSMSIDDEHLTIDTSTNQRLEVEKYEQVCIDVVWHTFYEKYWMFIDATIYSFAPLVLLTLFNIAIIRYLFKAADESLKLKESHKSSFSLSPPLTPSLTYLNNASVRLSTPTTPTSASTSPNSSNPNILINQQANTSNKANYQTLKVPVGAAKYYKKKSKTLTVSYMKTYFEEDEEDGCALNPPSKSALKRTPSNLTTDTCILSTPSGGGHTTTKSIVGAFEFTSNTSSSAVGGGGQSQPRRSSSQSQTSTNNHSVNISQSGAAGHHMISMGGAGSRSLRSNSNITVRSIGGITGHQQPSQPFKRLNTRITVMLITLNITFCIFSMPMVILQIIYFSFYPFLEATSYYMLYTTTPDAGPPTTFTTMLTTTSTRFAPTFSLLSSISNLTNMTQSLNISDSMMSSSSIEQAELAAMAGGSVGGGAAGRGGWNQRHTLYDIPVDEKMLAQVDLIKCIAELLQYLNHSTNFFLYSLSGKTFRNETKAFIYHHLTAAKQFFRNKKLKYFLHTAAQSSSSSSNHHNNNQQAGGGNDPERVRLRKQDKKKLKRQNSFKYSFRTNLV